MDKRGYNVEQVNKFIDTLTLKYEEKLSLQKDRVFSLRKEVTTLTERLEHFEKKDRQISQALISAIEKAEQIESSARKIYDLEVQRIRLLYKKWKEILQDMDDTFPLLLTHGKIHLKISEFTANIDSVILQNEKMEQRNKQNEQTNSDNYIKNLLSRMDNMINNSDNDGVNEQEKKLESERKREQVRLKSIQKRFSTINHLKNKNFDTYLNDTKVETNNAYAKLLTPKPSSVFNLEDVLNPKEDLDEIMKAFDFYNEELVRRKDADQT